MELKIYELSNIKSMPLLLPQLGKSIGTSGKFRWRPTLIKNCIPGPSSGGYKAVLLSSHSQYPDKEFRLNQATDVDANAVGSSRFTISNIYKIFLPKLSV